MEIIPQPQKQEKFDKIIDFNKEYSYISINEEYEYVTKYISGFLSFSEGAKTLPQPFREPRRPPPHCRQRDGLFWRSR